MSNLKDKILDKSINVNKDKTSLTIKLTIQHCTWRDGDRPILVDDSSVSKLLLEEGYNIVKATKSSSFYNDFSGKDKVEDKTLEWTFSLKSTKTTTKTSTRKKTTTKTNLTKETKSATVTQEDQQEDSESVE
jgi:hypothetical protein